MYVSCNPDSLVEDGLGQKGEGWGFGVAVWLMVKRSDRKQNMEVFFQG